MRNLLIPAPTIVYGISVITSLSTVCLSSSELNLDLSAELDLSGTGLVDL